MYINSILKKTTKNSYSGFYDNAVIKTPLNASLMIKHLKNSCFTRRMKPEYYALQYKEPDHEHPVYFLVNSNGRISTECTASSLEMLIMKANALGLPQSQVHQEVPKNILLLVRSQYAASSYITPVQS